MTYGCILAGVVVSTNVLALWAKGSFRTDTLVFSPLVDTTGLLRTGVVFTRAGNGASWEGVDLVWA